MQASGGGGGGDLHALSCAKVDLRHTGTPLTLACSAGKAEVVSILTMFDSVDVNLERSVDGKTPLHLASFHGHHECIDILLAHPSIDTEKLDSHGESAILQPSIRGMSKQYLCF